MTPQWILIVLGLLIPLVGVGVWHFLTQGDKVSAIWVGLITWCLLGLFIAIAWRNDVIAKRDAVQAKAAREEEIAETPESPPFFVEIEKVFVESQRKFDGTRWWLGYRSGYGDTVSPVSVMMFLRIVNLQHVPSMIERLVVELQIEEAPWIKLSRMDARGGEVFLAVEGLGRTRRIDFRPNGLNYLLADKHIQPNETLRGWVLFEIPQDYTFLEGIHITWRVSVRDTKGIEFIYNTKVSVTWKLAPPGTSDATQSQPWHVKEWRDLRSFHKKYYTDPVP